MLWGGAGDDLLVGFRGGDTMRGGQGNDRMVWNNGDGSDLMEGGAGNDTTEVNGSDTDGDEFTIAANGDRVDFDRVNLVPFSLDIGTTETLEVNGQGGDDTITGAEGLDGLIALSLDGGTGNDSITGGDGDDALWGGAGDDLLVGFRGGDTMRGGAGNDRMVWNNGDGSDLMEGGAGQDTAEVNGSDTDGDEFTIAANGDRVAFDRVNLVPFSLDIGTTETLEVNGQGGDDTITAGKGLDGLIALRLDGGKPATTPSSAAHGDDLIAGGRGHDVHDRATRAPTPSSSSAGSDTITDFEDGVDRIELVGLADDFGDLAGRIAASGDDVVIDFGAHLVLTLEDFSVGSVDASDFLFS